MCNLGYRRHRLKFPFWAGVCLLWMSGPSVQAALHHFRGLDSRVVEMKMRTFLNVTPSRGAVPVEVEVRNHTDRSRTWSFTFEALESWDRGKQISREASVTVDAKSTRTVRMLIPVYPSTQDSRHPSPRLEVRVSGPGTANYRQNLLSDGSFYGGGATRILAGISPELRVNSGTTRWNYSELTQEIQDSRLPLVMAELDPACFPQSDTGLSGLDVLLVSQSEWDTWTRNRDTVIRWVAAGGHLLLVGDEIDGPRRIGLGTLRKLQPPENMESLAPMLLGLDTLQARLTRENAFRHGRWDLRESLPPIRRPFAVLMILVIGVAAVLGPVNIWLSFRRKNSLQVLWMTPAMSVGISAMIGLVIVLQDGFGGHGVRSQKVLLLPDERLEVVWQEQVSRTGVLLSSGFTLPEDVWMVPVSTEMGEDDRGSHLSLDPPGDYGGDWFTNRRIQAQVLQRVRTSRSGIELSVRDGRRFAVSTVEQPFSRLVIRDRDRKLWVASDVRPGVETALSPAPPDEESRLREALSLRKENLFPGKDLVREPGWFYAESEVGDRYLDTLPSVRWSDRPVWYMGPVTGRNHE